MPIFIIEHLEPKVFTWCRLEYAHISKRVGKKNLVFTNTKSSVLKKFGKVVPQSIKKFCFHKTCILDPEAKQTLTPKKAREYDNFVLGGILGDCPPRKRTKQELNLPYPRYNLGKEQMSTDTAAIVAKNIYDGKALDKMQFQDGIEIHVKKGESIQLPYKYLAVKGKPLIAQGITKMLRKQKTF